MLGLCTPQCREDTSNSVKSKGPRERRRRTSGPSPWKQLYWAGGEEDEPGKEAGKAIREEGGILGPGNVTKPRRERNSRRECEECR